MSEVLFEGDGFFEVSRYCGPESLAVPWEGGASRTRYQIGAGTDSVTLNVQQAAQLRGVLEQQFGLRSMMAADGLIGELVAFANGYRGDVIGVTEDQRCRLLLAAVKLAGLLAATDD